MDFIFQFFFNCTIAKPLLSTALGNGEATAMLSTGLLHNAPEV